MLTNVISILLFAVVLLAVCWMLAEYYLGIKGQSADGDNGHLRFGSRTAFALSHFWSRVDGVREIPAERLKQEMGSAQMSGMEKRTQKRHRSTEKKVQSHEAESTGRKYWIRENM